RSSDLPRPDRHGREEEPAEGLPGGREGASPGSVAVEGAAGLGLRAGHRDPEAGQAEPRAPADRTLSLLLGLRLDQVRVHDLLRDPDRDAENRSGARWTGSDPEGDP